MDSDVMTFQLISLKCDFWTTYLSHCGLCFVAHSAGKILYKLSFSEPNFVLLRRLIVIVWRPLEHISASSSKTVGDTEKVFCGNMSGATRGPTRWHSHSAVISNKAWRSASLNVRDLRPIFFALTQLERCFDQFRSLKQSESFWNGLGLSFAKKVCGGRGLDGNPPTENWVILPRGAHNPYEWNRSLSTYN